MEEDYWSTLAQANVNDILSPFNIVFKADNPDTKSSGGHTEPSLISNLRFSYPIMGLGLWKEVALSVIVIKL